VLLSPYQTHRPASGGPGRAFTFVVFLISSRDHQGKTLFADLPLRILRGVPWCPNERVVVQYHHTCSSSAPKNSLRRRAIPQSLDQCLGDIYAHPAPCECSITQGVD
jgi:hypothetical protein